MGEEGCGSRSLTLFLLILQFFDDLFFAFFLKEQGEKGMERRGKFCLFVLACLRPFGLFSILPTNKSFKQFKRYALIKISKTKNYKLDSERGVKTSDERKRKREKKNQEKVKKRAVLNVKKRAVQRQKEGCKTVKKKGSEQSKEGCPQGGKRGLSKVKKRGKEKGKRGLSKMRKRGCKLK